jgi:hypothetical protein
MKICSISGCSGKFKAIGYCQKHYLKFRQYGDANKIIRQYKKYLTCSFSNCINSHYARGYCEKHYIRFMRHGDASFKIKNYKDFDKCSYPKCNRPHIAKGYCTNHYRSILKNDKVRETSRKRRASKRNNGFEKYTETQVLELYGTTCYLCNTPIDMSASRRCGDPGWEKGLHIEHVIDIALGGPDTLQNVRPSHGLCNLTKKPREMV